MAHDVRNDNEILNWKEFAQTPMWKMVCSMLNKKVKEAEAIIFAVGADKEVQFTQRDVAIVKRDAYLELIEMPENNIESLSSIGEMPMEEMDAYMDNGEEAEKKPEILSGIDITFIDDLKKNSNPFDQDF